jgi:hypothetical protein
LRPLHTGICGFCEVPTIWAKDSVLDGDNTSLQKMVPMRGVFYAADEIESLIDSMEQVLGISLSRLLFRAHSNAIRRFFDGTLRGLAGSLAKALVPRMIFEQQAKTAPYFGVGVLRLVEYNRGGGVVEMTNAWNERLVAAEIAGAFASVEGAECRVDAEATGGVVRLTVRRSALESEEYSGRLVPLTGKLMGTREYPRCHVCGAPYSFRVFRWDLPAGEIRERDTGLRVVHMTIACIDSMLQEMVDELGREMLDMAVRFQADYVRGMISSGAYDALEKPGADEERRFFDHLSLIRRRCLGNPIYIDDKPARLTVHIRNPANSVMLAGRVLGTFEAVRGTPGLLESERDGGMLRVTVSPS